MSQGCFYLLPETVAPEALPTAIVAWVCELTTDLYRQGLPKVRPKLRRWMSNYGSSQPMVLSLITCKAKAHPKGRR